MLKILVYLYYKKRTGCMDCVKIKENMYLIPDNFSETGISDRGFKIIGEKDADSFGAAAKYLKSGKMLILENITTSAAQRLFSRIEKRIEDIIPFEEIERISSKEFSRNRKREFDRIKNDILNSILVTAKGKSVTSFKSEEESIRMLFSFCGADPYLQNTDDEFILPYQFYCGLKKDLSEEIFVKALGMKICAGTNVLLPKSQETSALFRTAFESVGKRSGLKLIEIGCGSGVLTLLADTIFHDCEIQFSDILPEALASTIYNIEIDLKTGFEKNNGSISCRPGKNDLLCRESGDLFDKIDDVFDIIFFNPPWVDAPAVNRSELALNDKGQKTLERFLMQAKRRLKPDGRIILAFSDNSGDQAVEKLEKLLVSNGLSTDKEFSEKVQSYQSGRKWMRIFVKIIRTDL